MYLVSKEDFPAFVGPKIDILKPELLSELEFGIEANLFDNIVVDGSLTYTKGSSFREILPMPSIPPIFGFLKIKLIKEKSQLQLSYRFSGLFYRLFSM